MEAFREINRLSNKIYDKSLPEHEPLFTLRAQDCIAAGLVEMWCIMAKRIGVPAEKIAEAEALKARMDAWPVRRIPGRPETATDRRSETPEVMDE